MHASDSVDSAKREIALWFPELAEYEITRGTKGEGERVLGHPSPSLCWGRKLLQRTAPRPVPIPAAGPYPSHPWVGSSKR